MTWVIAIAGFCALIMVHEAGHFLAAKAVGMKVERFSLFFPPKLLSFRYGETDYQLGALPLGGYVKITGMSAEELATVDPVDLPRAYYNKEPWKRVVVILAGPAMNLLTAFLLIAALLMAGNLDAAIALDNLAPAQKTIRQVPTTIVGAIAKGSGAHGILKLGDRIVAIGGKTISPRSVDAAIQHDTCAGLDARAVANHFGVFAALGTSVGTMWDLGTSTITHYFDALVSSKARGQLQSAVGIAQDTQQAVAAGAGLALVLLALVSLVLAVVNLFPFLPLDGGHVVWSIAEKIRGKRISLSAMWRYSTPGVILLAFLVVSGISNDISRLSG